MLASRAMSYVNNLRTFVRVYELGSMSAAGRDQRISAAVASARIAELEKHLGVRLFNRTTRSLKPTEHGRIFYEGAVKILDTIGGYRRCYPPARTGWPALTGLSLSGISQNALRPGAGRRNLSGSFLLDFPK
jgi:DNA-binding transcriptional LysR family regulator